MDLLSPENKKFFEERVSEYTPPIIDKKARANDSTDQSASTDIIVAARIRPLLASEVDDGHAAGVYARSEGGYADVHELRKKISGKLVLNVSLVNLSIMYLSYYKCRPPAFASISRKYSVGRKSDLRNRVLT